MAKKPTPPPEPNPLPEEGLPPEPALPRVKHERFTQTLRCQLTPDEIADRADQAAHALARRDEKERDAKAAADQFKAEIKTLEASMRQLSNEVRDRATYRTTECERVFDYETGWLRNYRDDTGELVDERRLTAAEMQRELFDGETA